MQIAKDADEARARARAERYLASCSEYTDSKEHERLVNDWLKQGDVAEKVVGDFKKRAGEVDGKKLLDIGFGSGMYSVAFSRAGADVCGLEVNEVLLNIAKENAAEDGVSPDLRIYDGSRFPFSDNYFDYLFSVSVLEHVTDPRMLLKEAGRVLKAGGKFYLAFPNRLRPLEAHTHIPFLSYIPRGLAQFLLRLAGRNTVEELNLHFYSYFGLKQMLKGTGLKIIYEYESGSALKRMIKRTLAFFGIHHSAVLGTVMVILKKET